MYSDFPHQMSSICPQGPRCWPVNSKFNYFCWNFSKLFVFQTIRIIFPNDNIFPKCAIVKIFRYIFYKLGWVFNKEAELSLLGPIKQKGAVFGLENRSVLFCLLFILWSHRFLCCLRLPRSLLRPTWQSFPLKTKKKNKLTNNKTDQGD